MVMRSFDLDELPKAQGILQGTRSMVNLGTGPLGSALYTAGGYVLPYMIGPFVILGAYVALVWFSHYLDEVADPHKSKNLLQFLIDSRYPKLWGVVMFVLFLFIDVALYPSLLQVWLGAFPYCNPPNLVSAFLAATIGCFMIGLAIITTVSPIIGYINSILICCAIGFVLRLFTGKAPGFFPDLPQETGVGLAFLLPKGATLAPIATIPTWAAYYLSTRGVPRKDSDQPIGSMLIALAAVGNTVGPLTGAPLMDQYGTGVAYTGFAFLYLLGAIILGVAFWRDRGITEVKDEAEVKDETESSTQLDSTKLKEEKALPLLAEKA